MKVTYIFNLPEDQDEYDIYQRAIENETKVYEVSQYIRSKLKYQELSSESETILQEIRNLLH